MKSKAKRLLWSIFVLIGMLAVACSTAPASPGPAPAKQASAPPAAQAPADKSAAPAPAQKPAAPAPAAADKAPAAVPPKGGIVAIPITADPVFNHVAAQEPNSVIVNKLLFSSLVKPDFNTLQPAPDLATKWDVSSDGLTWTFYLRDDAVWHDGQPVTAEDVKFTYDAIMDKNNNSQLRSSFPTLESIVAVDKKTVQFKLNAPYAPLAVRLSDNNGILPKHILQGKDVMKDENFNKKNPIGSGAFKIKEFAPGSHVTLVPNDKYYGGRPNLDTIVIKVVPDQNVQVAQVKTGELSMINIEPPSLPAVQNQPGLKINLVDQVVYNLLVINHKRPLFADKRVRQAMVYALDRKQIVDVTLAGTGDVATGPIVPVLKWAFDDKMKPWTYDLEKAKALMAEAGWKPGPDGILQKDGQPFKFTLTVDKGNPAREQTAAIVQQFYKKIGMDVALETMEFGAFVNQRYFARNYDVLTIYKRYAADPDVAMDWATGASTNHAQYSNAEVDQLLNQAKGEVNQAKRAELYKKFQETIVDDVGAVFLNYPKGVLVSRSELQGLSGVLRLFDQPYYAEKWYLSK